MIEVSAPRVQSDSLLRATPGLAQGYDVSRARGRALMVSDVLTGAVGVHVRELGGAGSFATASIRGSTPAQVAVYLDGVPLNQAQYGVVNLADLPIEALDRVEVFRGAAPLALDSPGGGAVNLVSSARQGRWARVTGGLGSFGTSRSDAGLGWQARHWGAFVVGQYLESRGDYRFLDDNATPFNANDDTVGTRKNNWARTVGFTTHLSADAGPLRLSLTHDLLRKRNGVPGIGANQVLSSSMHTDRDVLNFLVAQRRERDQVPGATLRLYGAWHRDRFADPQGKLTGVRQASDNHTDRNGVAALVPFNVPAQQRITLEAEARRETYRPALVLPIQRVLAQSHRTYLAWGAEDRWTIPALRLTVLANWRRTETRDSFPAGPAYPGAFTSPAVSRTIVLDRPALGVTFDLTNGLAFKTSFGNLARTPTLEELFGNRAGVYGNPKALPEHVTTRDAGVIGRGARPSATWLPSAFEVQASVYRSDAKDLLIYIQNSQRSVVAMNVSSARLWGTEWDGKLTWRCGLTCNSSWTRQWTRDEGEVAYWHGRELPSRPRDEVAVQTALARHRWRVFHDYHFVSANWLDRYNAERAKARNIHDVGLGLRYSLSGVEWTAECRNVGDVRVQDYAGYPLPGRTFYTGLTLQISGKDSNP
ncbi:MAG TPA: TonB-dependent receptor [Thermoanaerobaculaceae bacterium]|nr:TonB-dependent receptor [Thermoanaerobaculaceae bacterium]